MNDYIKNDIRNLILLTLIQNNVPNKDILKCISDYDNSLKGYFYKIFKKLKLKLFKG